MLLPFAHLRQAVGPKWGSKVVQAAASAVVQTVVTSHVVASEASWVVVELASGSEVVQAVVGALASGSEVVQTVVGAWASGSEV